ncbi:J domain-containing protein [Maricaulaceae bacterium EIL42A08]|nr:J domain-containing protein [Maricaulaceae bacterium EIL42A08]
MTTNPQALVAAYKIFGLGGGEDFSEVRARFRAMVKEVHPDTSEPTAETLAKLQKLLKAYEVLKIYAPRRIDLEITPDEARKGGLRTIKYDDRDLMVRIPVAVKNGTMVTPIGDPNWRVYVTVRDKMVDADLSAGEAERKSREERAQKFAEQAAREEAEENAGVLRGFLDNFVKKSPAARLVSWARKGAA